jgi:hypothetical protein
MTAPEVTPVEAASTPAEKPRRGCMERLTGPRLSPHGLLSCAAILTLTFMFMHLLGLREYTTIISGTSPTGDPQDWFAALIGVFYILFYLAFTMLVPLLLIAAGLLALGFALPARSRKTAD